MSSGGKKQEENHDGEELNPWVRALKRVNLEGVFEEFGIPKLTKTFPPRIRIVRKAPPIENKPIQEQTENQENKK